VDTTKKDWSFRTKEEWNRHRHRKKRERERNARLTPEAKKQIIHNAGKQLANQEGTTSNRGVFPSFGTREHDIWRPEEHEPESARPVDDDRRAKTFCRRCKAEVEVKQEGAVWITYDLDGTPHHETCPDPAPPPEEW